MKILSMFFGAMLALLIIFLLDVVSFVLTGRSLSSFIFGSSGFQFLVAIMAGCILGWIWGEKVQDRKEQLRINRELEQDRIRYEKENIKSVD